MKKKKEIQRRAFNVQARASDADGDELSEISGHAIVYNQIAHGEMIAPGAVTKTLQEQRDIKAYWGHDRNKPLGRTSNGTLELESDDTGLFVKIRPNKATSFGRDALASIERGDVSQMSFGFVPVKQIAEKINEIDVNVVKELRLTEVSPVADPWYQGTTAEARDKEESNGTAPEPVQGDHSTLRAMREKRERQIQLGGSYNDFKRIKSAAQ